MEGGEKKKRAPERETRMDILGERDLESVMNPFITVMFANRAPDLSVIFVFYFFYFFVFYFFFNQFPSLRSLQIGVIYYNEERSKKIAGSGATMKSNYKPSLFFFFSRL